MTAFPSSPRLLKAGLVIVDPASGAVNRVIALQYNPDSLSRTLQAQAMGGEGARQSEALRLKGPAVETFKLEAEIDAADQLELPGANPTAVAAGIQPQLAELETQLYPTCAQLTQNYSMALAGTLEILPMEGPLVLFVWRKNRILPVRITEFSVTEEAFDPSLNPIRAKLSLGLRVLSVDDLGFTHRGGSLFMSYLRQKESLAGKGVASAIGALGLSPSAL